MNKAELARQLGVSRTYITLLVQGKRKPSQQIANKLGQLMLTHDSPCHNTSHNATMKNSRHRHGPLAQLAEQLTLNQPVGGSSPPRLIWIIEQALVTSPTQYINQ
jgi:DNA-binding XRE family transcriptional regulator